MGRRSREATNARESRFLRASARCFFRAADAALVLLECLAAEPFFFAPAGAAEIESGPRPSPRTSVQIRIRELTLCLIRTNFNAESCCPILRHHSRQVCGLLPH